MLTDGQISSSSNSSADIVPHLNGFGSAGATYNARGRWPTEGLGLGEDLAIPTLLTCGELVLGVRRVDYRPRDRQLAAETYLFVELNIAGEFSHISVKRPVTRRDCRRT